ncbi:MAG TPA: hypothetical protein VKG26_03060 [Bacteroidia bacterium]|nr:hypothetical protein [Bacteroidia bacterium]
MKKLLYFLFFSFISLGIFSQEKGYLEFAGRCVKSRQPIKGAIVAIYKNGVKVTDITTGKNGKFQFFLDFGVDYKVTFTYTGCADMYLMIYASKCPADKSIFPIYDGDVPFFEFNNPTINYPLLKNPFTKIVYDGKKTFGDDEPYVKDFLEKLLIDPEEINKKNVQLAIEKEKLEMEAKLKREAEEKERQEQLAEAQRKAEEEAERIKKQNEELARAQKKNNEAKNQVAKQEDESNQSMASEEVQLTIDKEKRSIKEKQNKAIRSTYESDLLKIVATNERKEKEGQFTKNKDKAQANEVIETLQKEAEVKARSEQIVFDFKMRNKQVVLNRGIKNKEMLTLIRQTAFNEKEALSASIKKYPDPKNYKPAGLVGISSDVDKGTFKTTYTYTISVGNNKTIYRRENFNWGLNYYYKNDKEINELDYLKEIAQYNIQ